MHKTPKGKFLYGYVVAASCFGIQAVGIGTYFSYGVLFNPLISEFDWSRAAVAGAVGPFLAGYIFDITATYDVVIWIRTLVATLGFVLVSLLKPLGKSKTPAP